MQHTVIYTSTLSRFLRMDDYIIGIPKWSMWPHHVSTTLMENFRIEDKSMKFLGASQVK